MLKSLEEFLLQRELLTVTVGLVAAFAIFSFIDALVRGLVAPIIAAVFAQPGIEFMVFTINYSEFSYGAVISAALVLLLTFVAALAVAAAARAADRRG